MNKKIKIWLFLLFTFIGTGISSTHAYQELMIEEKWGKPIRVIKVVLDGEHFVVASPAGLWWDTTENLAKKVWGNTAINAAFFCPDDYSNCRINGKRVTHTISERVFLWDGKSRSPFWWDTSIRAIFSFDKEGKPFFVQKNSGLHDEGLRSNINQDKLDQIYFWIWNFPVLLLEGEDVVKAYVNYIDSKMSWSANRNFICSTQDWKTVYMGVVWGISVKKLAPYLRDHLGCRNALSLDAWASTAMVYEGKTLDRSPRTRVMDAFVVLTKAQYQKLTGSTPNGQADKITGYQGYLPTSGDFQKLSKIQSSLDQIFLMYGKNKYKQKFINRIRKMISSELSLADKWLYNQLLISLYTIDTMQ